MKLKPLRLVRWELLGLETHTHRVHALTGNKNFKELWTGQVSPASFWRVFGCREHHLPLTQLRKQGKFIEDELELPISVCRYHSLIEPC